MPLSSSDLERMADDIYRGRLLTISTYCAKCGYNLLTLPYVYTCPECGNKYNARPLLMKGIFIPSRYELPLRDLFVVLGFAVATAVIGYGAFKPLDVIRLVIGLFFAASTVICTAQLFNRLMRYIQAVQIIRRIKLEEGDE